MKRRAARGMGIIVSTALVLTLAGCAEKAPDEEQIRSRIEAMQTALADGDVSNFMAPVAEDFTAATRSLDRRAARLLLRREMLAHQKLRARLVDIEIELIGPDRASATMHAITSGGSGLIPATGGWYRLSTGWRRDSGEWMLISANWERLAGRR